MPQEIVTRTVRYYVEDDILYAVMLPVENTIADARENVRAITQLIGDRRYPCLADMRLLKSIDRETRMYYVGPEMTRLMSVVAMVIKSPLQRLIGNFFLTVNKAAFPIRLFTSETEALAWLRNYAPKTA